MHLTVVGRGSARALGGGGRNASAVGITAPVRPLQQPDNATETRSGKHTQQPSRPCSETPSTQWAALAAAVPLPRGVSQAEHSHSECAGSRPTIQGTDDLGLVQLQLPDLLASHQVELSDGTCSDAGSEGLVAPAATAAQAPSTTSMPASTPSRPHRRRPKPHQHKKIRPSRRGAPQAPSHSNQQGASSGGPLTLLLLAVVAAVALAPWAANSSSNSSSSTGVRSWLSSPWGAATPVAAAGGGSSGSSWLSWAPTAAGSSSSHSTPHRHSSWLGGGWGSHRAAATAAAGMAAGASASSGSPSPAARTSPRAGTGWWPAPGWGAPSSRRGTAGSTLLAAAAAAAAAAGGGGGTAGTRRGPAPSAAASLSTAAAAPQPPRAEEVGPAIRLLTIVPGAGAGASPYKGAGWGEVMDHMASRLAWVNPRFDMQVVNVDQLQDAAFRDQLGAQLAATPPAILMGVGITHPAVAAWLAGAAATLPTSLFWDSDPVLVTRVDGYSSAAAGPLAQALARLGGLTREGRAAAVLSTVEDLWGRHTSDDLLYTWLVLLNQYQVTVPEVANTTKGSDLASIMCMVQHCSRQIVDCIGDTTCKAGLDCLQACAFNDQVCQYRCIVSHETPKFGSFALCILQLHNCRNLDARAPTRPDPAAMTTWRGAPLTHAAAEDMFLGWLGGVGGPVDTLGDLGAPRPWSWLIAAGKNPAYDFFPCQHQLFYRGKGAGQVWYEPVFKAITLDNQQVWRRRRYRVRRGSTPGTFHFSVLDNGVTSNEYWRILDCADDLSFCLFYYSGAASAAGLSYSGAVLGTPDGAWPAAHTERVTAALEAAGIKPWELSNSDNSNCAGAPLDLEGTPAALVPAA